MTTRTASRARAGFLAAGFLLAITAAACTGGAAPTALPSPTAASPATEPATEPAASPAASDPGKVIPSLNPTVIPGEGVPPEVVQQAVTDAATRAGVETSAVTVVSAAAVTWPNGAAGCPRMGFMYTDIVTPGYRVVVKAGGTTYDYRGSQRSGTLNWCENPPGPG